MAYLSPSPHLRPLLRWQLPELVRAALAAGLPIAAWRSPFASSPQAVVQLAEAVRQAPVDLTQPTPGFVVAPFLPRPGQEAIHLRADLWYTDDGALRLSDDAAGHEGMERLVAAHAGLRHRPTSARPAWPIHTSHPPVRCLSQEAYCSLVARGVDAIRRGDLQKVVLSRVLAAPLPPAFDPVDLFGRLAQRYPAAFVSLVAIPGVGTWLGATPELLMEADGWRLRTVALAGTRPLPPSGQAVAVRWSAKEIEEQALVSRYVSDFFRRQGVPVREQGPYTAAAGQVAHLQTAFEVSLPPEALAQLATQVVQTLHPTPAVCGVPREAAAAFILTHEPHPREFYSGFLGPTGLDGRTSFYVNLRCLRLERTRALLYVGAGITAASDPCAEWHETALKARTLLAVLYDTASAVEPPAPVGIPALEAAR